MQGHKYSEYILDLVKFWLHFTTESPINFNNHERVCISPLKLCQITKLCSLCKPYLVVETNVDQVEVFYIFSIITT